MSGENLINEDQLPFLVKPILIADEWVALAGGFYKVFTGGVKYVVATEEDAYRIITLIRRISTLETHYEEKLAELSNECDELKVNAESISKQSDEIQKLIDELPMGFFQKMFKRIRQWKK